MSVDRKLIEASEEELAAMLAKKRAARMTGQTADEMEVASEEAQRRETCRTLQSAFDAASAKEDSVPKACPKCGRATSVKRKGILRTVQSVAGPVRLVRNHHYCKRCRLGFYPLDAALDLPTEGTLTALMSRRVLVQRPANWCAAFDAHTAMSAASTLASVFSKDFSVQLNGAASSFHSSMKVRILRSRSGRSRKFGALKRFR